MGSLRSLGDVVLKTFVLRKFIFRLFDDLVTSFRRVQFHDKGGPIFVVFHPFQQGGVDYDIAWELIYFTDAIQSILDVREGFIILHEVARYWETHRDLVYKYLVTCFISYFVAFSYSGPRFLLVVVTFFLLGVTV